MQADSPSRTRGETPAARSPSAVQIERGYFWAMRRLGSFFWVQSFFGTCFSLILYPPALVGVGLMAWLSYDEWSSAGPGPLMAAIALLCALVSGALLLVQSIRIASRLRGCLPLSEVQARRYVERAFIHYGIVGLVCFALGSVSLLFLLPAVYCASAIACTAGLHGHLRDQSHHMVGT
jgi:hypothetical protein